MKFIRAFTNRLSFPIFSVLFCLFSSFGNTSSKETLIPVDIPNRLNYAQRSTSIPILIPLVLIGKETNWLKKTASINNLAIRVSEDRYSIYFGGSWSCIGSGCSFASASGSLTSISSKFNDYPNIKEVIRRYYVIYADYLYVTKKKNLAPSRTKGGYITLLNGIKGYYVPSYCFNQCSSAHIVWETDKFTYRVTLSKGGSLGELVKIANSAIKNRVD